METFTDNTLTLELAESPERVVLAWKGKSNDREPARFLVPVLEKALSRGEGGKREVVLDFSALDYMNSSTFSPLVKLLDQAAKGGHRVSLVYSQARKWQALSFSALKAFETGDGRVRVHGR
jgi:hypothetical protein